MEGFEKAPEHWTEYAPLDSHEIDAIFVLAGGLDDMMQVHPWVRGRLDTAAAIHEEYKVPIICLGGGTYHKPAPISEHGYVIHESTACAHYLVNERGVDADKVYKEWASYDTIANGLFAFQHFIVPLKLKHVIVITSEFHMPRTQTIFQHMQQLHQGLARCRIEFEVTQNFMDDQSVLEDRKQREGNSLRKYQTSVVQHITSLTAFVHWFYTEHACYSSQPKQQPQVASSSACKSY